MPRIQRSVSSALRVISVVHVGVRQDQDPVLLHRGHDAGGGLVGVEHLAATDHRGGPAGVATGAAAQHVRVDRAGTDAADPDAACRRR